ncbi:DRTGG domain-containing protein [Thermus sp.]|uniref:DRTGG domain-containing protein n=1 Tax=Thermus sp. TaxID=275 RepID=UPI0026223124|nr:DRTGG domain-containing protein [Thermus sp.]MCS7216312.1 DRTGG domain-containing protein [Candidatus Bipolaricaulota bacterium]MCX7850287.1 DRTGG domain-containing protein [Thermus sp.]MDW8151542.1 DRTGG domain-containing protein [Candidatus Bipolaricaulota bacterium]
MKLREVAERLGLEFLVAADPEAEVRGGYVSDLLSDVLAHAEAGDLWITHQRHLNVVAVAKLRGVAGVVLARGLRPGPETLQRAQQEGVNLLTSPADAFDTAGRLHRLLAP